MAEKPDFTLEDILAEERARREGAGEMDLPAPQPAPVPDKPVPPRQETPAKAPAQPRPVPVKAPQPAPSAEPPFQEEEISPEEELPQEKPKKKKRFQFFRDVKSEMKRVTWPTRTDVLRWSGVVVVALLFFGVFVAILDNAIITPLLVLISGIGA